MKRLLWILLALAVHSYAFTIVLTQPDTPWGGWLFVSFLVTGIVGILEAQGALDNPK